MPQQHNTLALLGGAETTREDVWNREHDEIWTMNWSYRYDWVPYIDRLFEMHQVWLMGKSGQPEYQKVTEHWEWLKEERPYPIYMLGDFRDEVPSCVEYPILEVTEHIFGTHFRKGDKPTRYYGSSVDYMLALAIYEHDKLGYWDRVEMYGIEMLVDTEYRYQRDGLFYLLGQANARGMITNTPEHSRLLRTKCYGYEGAQMIFRQDLERLHEMWAIRKRDSFSILQNLEGQLQTLLKNGKGESREAEKLAFKVRDKRDEAAVAAGWVQCLEYQIKEIDLEEPEDVFESPFVTIFDEDVNGVDETGTKGTIFVSR